VSLQASNPTVKPRTAVSPKD